ncbi:MAG: hypothetical protein ACOH2J_18825 [Allorhizobium sp.]
MFLKCSVDFAITMTIGTPGKAARHKMQVIAACCKCGRQARFPAADVANFYNFGHTLACLPFKCRECELGDSRITAFEYLNDRARQIVVWRQMKLKWPVASGSGNTAREQVCRKSGG